MNSARRRASGLGYEMYNTLSSQNVGTCGSELLATLSENPSSIGQSLESLLRRCEERSSRVLDQRQQTPIILLLIVVFLPKALVKHSCLIEVISFTMYIVG